ncbi:HAD-IA family hydrolase [bacterium]|nr:HAD-IA family hydrolase [bacterium]
MIKVITFDLDGVYFPNGKQIFVDSVEKPGVPADEIKRVFAHSDQMNNEYKLGKIGDEEFWNWASKEWKLNKTAKELIDILIDSYTVDEKIVSIVKKVRESGYKTAICTSNFPARINGLQQKFGFLDNFDIKVISYEVGFNKPNQEIYKKLVQISNVNPEEIIFADDNLESVENAKSVGITTFIYEHFDKYLKQLQEVGVTFR